MKERAQELFRTNRETQILQVCPSSTLFATNLIGCGDVAVARANFFEDTTRS